MHLTDPALSPAPARSPASAHAPAPAHAPASAGAAATDLGALPEWNLADLYPAMDDPAVKADLQKAVDDARAFEAANKGKLETLAREDAAGLAKVVKDYEALQELLGRLISFAGLVYSGQTTDPRRQKFYGDVQDRLTTAGTSLLFFELELNRIEDAVLDAAMANAKLAHYKPWFTDIRKERPYQLEDRVEQLFHEKSATGRAAWNRLFDETISSLQFEVDGKSLGVEATLNFMQDPDREKRRKAGEALAKVFGENLSTFTLITNTLAKDKEISDRWRGFADVADSRHLANRVEREVVDALVGAVHEAYPRLSHRYYGMKAKWLGLDTLMHYDRNAPLPKADDRKIPWDEAKATVLDAYAGFSPDMAGIAERFFDRNWIDAPVRAGKAPGAFAHPTVPSAHPYVLVNYQGKTRGRDDARP